MKLYKIILLALLCSLFVSCAKWGKSENSRLMQQAQGLVEHAPDSALMLLDSVNTALLSRKGTAEFTLLRVQARTNADRDLTFDNEIFRAYEYFAKKKDAKNAAFAGFYSALVANAQNNTTLQMDYYIKTLPFAEKANKYLLLGKIYNNMGFLNYDSDLYNDAITNYRKALKYYKAAGNQYRREIFTMNDMANAFLIEKQTDSAQFYYRKSLELAQWHVDTAQQVIIYTNMGVAGKKMEQLDTAIFYYRKSSRLAKDESEKAYIYKNLADIYHEKKELDSAGYYISRAEPLYQKLDNRYAMASLNYSYYQIEKSGGNYRKAMEYLEVYAQYQDELNDSRDRQLLLDMQKKYDTALLENEFNREKSRWLTATAILGCGVLALALAVFYARNENEKKKTALERAEKENLEQQLALEKMKRENMENQLALEKMEREKMEQQIALEKMEREKEEIKKELETVQNLFSRRVNEMRNAIIDKLGIIKGITGLRQEVEVKKGMTHEKMKETIDQFMAGFTVKKIMETINEGYPGLVEELKGKYPQAQLSDREICVCCLCIFGFENNEIAFLIEKNKKTKAVENWKTIIRKKLGIDDYGDIQKSLKAQITGCQK